MILRDRKKNDPINVFTIDYYLFFYFLDWLFPLPALALCCVHLCNLYANQTFQRHVFLICFCSMSYANAVISDMQYPAAANAQKIKQ